MDPLKKLKERWGYFPQTESNSLSHQMAALETARDKLREFCRTMPKCSDDLNCETCEIIDKIIELGEKVEDLGELQEALDITTAEYK